jgi:hypothetical protein
MRALRFDPETVETNIVVASPEGGEPAANLLVGELKLRVEFISQLTPDSIRLVTHRHIGYNEVSQALSAIRACLG